MKVFNNFGTLFVVNKEPYQRIVEKSYIDDSVNNFKIIPNNFQFEEGSAFLPINQEIKCIKLDILKSSKSICKIIEKKLDLLEIKSEKNKKILFNEESLSKKAKYNEYAIVNSCSSLKPQNVQNSQEEPLEFINFPNAVDLNQPRQRILGNKQLFKPIESNSETSSLKIINLDEPEIKTTPISPVQNYDFIDLIETDSDKDLSSVDNLYPTPKQLLQGDGLPKFYLHHEFQMEKNDNKVHGRNVGRETKKKYKNKLKSKRMEKNQRSINQIENSNIPKRDEIKNIFPSRLPHKDVDFPENSLTNFEIYKNYVYRLPYVEEYLPPIGQRSIFLF